MSYKLTQYSDISKVEKFEIKLDIYPDISDCGAVVAETETGHNEEFYHKSSTFSYIVLEGRGSFFLNDEEVKVHKGDFLTIEPKTRIYYKGKMKLALITNPPWRADDEVETRATIW